MNPSKSNIPEVAYKLNNWSQTPIGAIDNSYNPAQKLINVRPLGNTKNIDFHDTACIHPFNIMAFHCK